MVCSRMTKVSSCCACWTRPSLSWDLNANGAQETRNPLGRNGRAVVCPRLKQRFLLASGHFREFPSCPDIQVKTRVYCANSSSAPERSPNKAGPRLSGEMALGLLFVRGRSASQRIAGTFWMTHRLLRSIPVPGISSVIAILRQHGVRK
jgi:hypothetical protein